MGPSEKKPRAAAEEGTVAPRAQTACWAGARSPLPATGALWLQAVFKLTLR